MRLHTFSKTRLVISLMILLVLASTFISVLLVYNYAKNEEVNSIRRRVSTFALTLDSSEIHILTGTEEDINSPAYKSLKAKLVSLKSVNPDIRFVYLMGQKNEEIFFLADSEQVDTEDYSPPGQVYDEATPALYNAFLGIGPMQEVSSDRWGKWLSVFAPIVDQTTGQIVALAGFDMPYQSYQARILVFCGAPLGAGLILTILLIGAWIIAKKDESLLKIRSEYFSIAAHDLRTPLTGIKWALMALVKSKPPAPPKYQTMLKEITKSADNMILSVNELLDGSSLESGKAKQLLLVDVSLEELIASALKPLEISAQEKSITIKWKVPLKPITILGDADKLRRVFANLFSNAIKYSNEKGIITITTATKNEKAEISITDSGIGIPQNEQVKVFEGYFRASNAKTHTSQGTGLGLYYVKNVIAAHHGGVALNSTPGKGTTITIILPVKKSV